MNTAMKNINLQRLKETYRASENLQIQGRKQFLQVRQRLGMPRDPRRPAHPEANPAPITHLDREFRKQVDSGAVEKLQPHQVQINTTLISFQHLFHQGLNRRVILRTRQTHRPLIMNRAAIDPDPIVIRLDFHSEFLHISATAGGWRVFES